MIFETLKADKLLLVKTTATCMTFGVIGFAIAIVGPTLLDLQLTVNGTLHETATILPSRAVGRAIGCIMAGFLPESINVELLFSLGLLGISACFSLAPRLTSIYALDTVLFAAGLVMGLTDVSSNVYALRIWPEYATGFTQLCNLFYGIGSLSAPLIAQPFLLPTVEINVTRLTQNETQATEDMQVHYVYDILSLYSFVTAALFLIISRVSRHVKGYKGADTSGTAATRSEACSVLVIAFVGLTCNLEFGIHITYNSMLELFLVKGPPKLSKSTGALMTGAYSASYTFFKTVAMVMLLYTRPFQILVLHLGILVVGNILLAVSQENEPMLWISVCVVGIGFSSIYCLVLGYTQQYYKVGFTAMSVFLVSQCIGEGLYPLLIAATIESWPSAFVVVGLFCSGLLCAVVACIHRLYRTLPERAASSCI